MTRPALILIDMQNCMLPACTPPRNNPDAEERMAFLLSLWREAGAPVVHVRHVSRDPASGFRPGQPGVEFQPRFAPWPDEWVVDKQVTDAFLHGGLADWLRAREIGCLVVVGVSTNNSVEASVRTAGNMGFSVRVVADATFTFDKLDYHGRLRTADEVHAMSLANLDGEYARIINATEAASLP